MSDKRFNFGGGGLCRDPATYKWWEDKEAFECLYKQECKENERLREENKILIKALEKAVEDAL